jgi:hypothetical protein
MWIITTIGFFSVVQKPWDDADDTLTVRARVRADLEGFIEVANEGFHQTRVTDIVEDPKADYRFRIRLPRTVVDATLVRLAERIDYDNFKDAVSTRQGHERAATYSRVWSDLLQLQRLEPIFPAEGVKS